jgi:gliding motility-associated lipoprotein GldH
MRIKSSIAVIMAAVCLFSCDKKRVFDEYKSVGNEWHKDSVVSFDINEIDTLKSYNLFVNLRANSKYPFSNLFLIVSIDHPGKLTNVDTLEYQMADAEGNILGDGFTDIKESRLFYKEKVKFKKGTYKVHIRHAVRETGKIAGMDGLKGITEVGFRIETTQ